MSLLDDLREVADKIPPSDIPSVAELGKIVAGIVGYVEKPDSFVVELKKLGQTDVQQIATDAQAAAPVDDTRIVALENAVTGIGQQIQTLVANLQRTQVTFTSPVEENR